VESAENQRMRVNDRGSPIDPESREDARLLALVAEGDQNAFAALYRRQSGLIYSLLVRMLVHEMEAQEIMQDAFMQIWKRAAQYDPAKSSPLAWIIMISRGLAIDRLRARSRRNVNHAAYERELVSLEMEINGVPQMERNDLADACSSALNHLPEEQSHALQLAFFRGWTHEEIANAVGEPLGTIKARIRRGLLALRNILKEYNG
jgi:RNA polymerase sigma-70 factor (ECF subfamily)